jgi:hypothetical protein
MLLVLPAFSQQDGDRIWEPRNLSISGFQTKDKANMTKTSYRFSCLHAIMRDNTQVLFIRPITPIQKGESVEDAEKRMDKFVREMMETLENYLEKNISATSHKG